MGYFKSLLFIPLLLIPFSQVSSQSTIEKVDSIYRYSQNHPRDSAALFELNASLFEVYIDNSDTAIYYADKQLSMSRRGGWPNLESRALMMFGASLEISGDLDSAVFYYKHTLRVATGSKESEVMLLAHNGLGRVYSKQGLYQLAIEETLKAVELVEQSQDQRQNASILNSVGLRYNELNRSIQAVEFFQRSLKLNTLLKDSLQMAVVSSNLGDTYLSLNNLDSSKYYFHQTLALADILGNRYQNMSAHSGMVRIHLLLLQLDSAQWSLDSLELIAHNVKDIFRMHETDILQGQILLRRGEYRKAIAYLNEALEWFSEGKSNYVKSRIEILQFLTEAYTLAGENEKALKSLNEMVALKDQINTEQRDKAMEQVDIYRRQRQERESDLLNQKVEHQTGLRNLFLILGILMFILLAVSLNRYLFERKTKKLLAEKSALIEFQKERSEQLLLNILPADVAEELKEKGRSDASHFDQVTVLFTDFVSFTDISANLSAQELVEEIDHCFRAFDEIMKRHNIEKIKTIGDAYMAAGDLRDDEEVHPIKVVLAALEMQEFMISYSDELAKNGRKGFQMRVGIHTGPVVAGIVGMTKFQYDIWGDTVNTASRMESHGDAGKVNISSYTYEMLKDEPTLVFENRGKVPVKGKGEMEMYFVDRSTS